MAFAGKIFHQYTHVETDENGNIWVIFNNDEDSVINEMQAVADGFVITEYFDEDELEELWME